jgi:hypothetical protein
VAGSRLEKALLDSIASSYRDKRAWCRDNRAALISEHRREWKVWLIRPLWQLRKALRAHDAAQADLWEKAATRGVLEFESSVFRKRLEGQHEKAKERARKGGAATAKARGSRSWRNSVDAMLKTIYQTDPWLRGNARAAGEALEESGMLARLRVKPSTVIKYIEELNRLPKK